jgi:hypothetical protein
VFIICSYGIVSKGNYIRRTRKSDTFSFKFDGTFVTTAHSKVFWQMAHVVAIFFRVADGAIGFDLYRDLLLAI